MRLFLSAFILALLAGCASSPKPTLTSIEIEEIKPRYIKEASFKRISSYLSGKEDFGNRVILSSDPSERTGFYFTLILSESIRRLPTGTVIEGEFFTPASVEQQKHEFSLPNKRPRTKEIFIGLTGADWPQNGGTPAAWRFSIKDPNGKVLAEKQSYLWSF